MLAKIPVQLQVGYVMIDKNHGFTLIELLVAVVILMIGLLGLLQTINLAMAKNLETVFRNEAYSVANEKMMEKTSKAFVSLSAGSIAVPKIAGRVVRRNIRGIFKNYSVKDSVAQITAVGQVGVPASKKVDVTVSWNNKNVKYNHSVSSILSTSNSQ
jgi:type IV pilus assembly protein PilV